MNAENYYLKSRESGKNIYDIWEQGQAYQDSVTPATYDQQYRAFINQKIESVIGYQKSKCILSIGSGNAFVESDLHQKGYCVIANDVNKEAVELARQKGLEAVWADIKDWEPMGKTFHLIYGDGVAGHLYDQRDGLKAIFSRLKFWLSEKEGSIIISNDPATNGELLHRHPQLESFYWFSAEYICSELLKAGFKKVDFEYFVYNRPISGPRKRLIVTGNV